MQIFLAGGTGVLGRRIVPLLLRGDHQVTVMARRPDRARDLLPAEVAVVAGDALDADSVSAAVEAARPELVMHQLTDLADGSSQANARIRVEGTRHLVDAALAVGARRFVVQSIAWCYAPGPGPADETAALDTASEDAGRRTTVDAVRTMEELAARLPEWVALRNGLLYGPGTWYAPDGLFAHKAKTGDLLAGGDVSSFVHVDDAAAASVAAMDWPSGVVNVADDEPAAGIDWVPAFCSAVAAPEPGVVDGSGQPWARGVSNARARSLGWVPAWPSWRAGFETGLT